MRDDTSRTPAVRHRTGPCRWDAVDLMAYKEEGAAPFRAVSRQILFSEPWLAGELRYFECEPGGHTTLERHEHAHGVMILTGAADCLLETEVHRVEAMDLVSIPPMTWHQFRTVGDAPMGFLCMVNAERDRPQLPTEADLAGLRAVPAVAAFLDGA
jgi:quercetin dioxygenase-like cupin family protein